MSEIVLVDTSVLMNVLNVPGRNQDREAVIAEFTRLVQGGAHLFLPMAAVFEAGNHIAQLADGQARRSAATIFGEEINAAEPLTSNFEMPVNRTTLLEADEIFATP